MNRRINFRLFPGAWCRQVSVAKARHWFARFVCELVLGLLLAPLQLFAQGYSPEAAVQHMTVPDGFQVSFVASEPMIAQPVAIEFDDRGRLWVIQYLQYPNPAGLQRVKVDRYSRTVYDRVPEPPPRGPKGADRVTILEDTDGDGRADIAKDFARGLNLASGLAFGHGGVFILQVPFLLFYPDRNSDDLPDSNPEVLLTGFGMEDAHSVANSLTWGPDGWLYGCQGSTVTANIRGLEFQQGVWRYHPLTHRFELFCEGGGNSWGLDFDADGNLIYSTNVGGYRMLHGVQGGYYWKSFGKHGALHNPYTFGFFDHVPHEKFTGGHVTVGGLIYQGDSFPEKFRGKYIAGDLLGHGVQWHHLEPSGSTLTSSQGGELLAANDTWFAPSDVTMGPDGAIYVADWCDKRTAHPDPDAEWDRSNGRVYRIAAQGTKPAVAVDLAKLPSTKLVSLLSHKNNWLVRKARRLLADRRDPEIILPLRSLIFETQDDQLALEALWALNVSGGFNESFADKLLTHRSPHIRRWTVRLLGDENKASPATAARLIKMAAIEPNVIVRSQLASTAKRLPAISSLPISQNILQRDMDVRDAHIPLLLWWAVEYHAVSAMNRVLDMLATASAWQSPMTRDAILPRLMRRYASEGTEAALDACARLLAEAPTMSDHSQMLAALDLGMENQPMGGTAGNLFETQAVAGDKPQTKPALPAKIPAALASQLASLWTDDTTNATLIRLTTRAGHRPAFDRAVAVATDAQAPAGTRIALLQLLGEVGRHECIAPLLKLPAQREPEPVQLAALEALQNFNAAEIAASLLRDYPRMSPRVRSKARYVLLSRGRWALAFLRAIDEGQFPNREVPVEQLRRVSLLQDKTLDELVLKHWGRIQSGTPEEKLAEMRRLANDLRAGGGGASRGRELFKTHCAVCHRLFDEGDNVGPDLTHANRQDREFLLASLVDPSAVIRKEFLSFNVETADGRFLSGLIAEQSANSITLIAARNERTTVSREKIKSLQESPVSLMPENLLQSLKPQELRDLFSYLQSGGKADR